MSIVEVVRRTTTTVEIGHPGVQGPAGTGGGGGAVDSVNGQTGVVVLDATDVGADATGTASAALAAHVAAADPHSVYALESSLGTAAPLNVAASGDAASGEVVKGNDSRLTDSRTPTTHTHASTAISDSTAIGRTVLTAADAAAVRTAISVPSGSGTVSGTNTGDQTITLTGGVTGSGTGSFAATVVTNANLTGPVTSTGNATAIANGAISNAMLANGAVANLSGTNTGDETGARVATLLHAANNKTSLVDADEVNGTDSAASFGLIRTTWTNVKAFLKTYFDTLYQAVLVSGTNIKTINSSSILGSGNLTVSATPGGSTTQVQFNNAGAFSGDSGLTYASATKNLTVGYRLDISGSATNVGASLAMGTTGAYKISNDPGGMYYEASPGHGFLTAGQVAWAPMWASQFKAESTGLIGFTSGNPRTASLDIALSRISSGQAGLGTGAAGSFAGALKLRNLIATGNLAIGIVAKTANYTVTANDHTIECDATSGAITLTLPAVSGAQAGTQYTLKKTDASANAVTFDGNASETIDGATTLGTTTQWASITIRRNAAGTAWITTRD